MINPVAFEIGPCYSLVCFVCVAGLVLAVYLAMKELLKKILSDVILDFIHSCFSSSYFRCFRLYYVLFRLGHYLQNPGEIIAIWNSGLAIYGV